MPKVKYRERTLKNSKRNAVSYLGGVPIRLAADFSKGTLQARRDLQEIFKVMKSRDLQPILFYPAKISFQIKRQIKSCSD